MQAGSVQGHFYEQNTSHDIIKFIKVYTMPLQKCFLSVIP